MEFITIYQILNVNIQIVIEFFELDIDCMFMNYLTKELNHIHVKYVKKVLLKKEH
jgi:hypothetical protein